MKTPVFHSFPEWQLSGVNTWSANLIRESAADTDFTQSVLFTGVSRRPQPDFDVLGLPHSFLEVHSPRRRKDEWSALKRFLESSAPCIYIPQYDFHRSSAVPTLSPNVKVCAVIHSDEDCYYDLVRRIGYACDAIVTVSSYLACKVREKFPKLASRVHFIPYGVPLQRVGATRAFEGGRLNLAYCNRLAQYQKRIFDLPEVCRELIRLNVDFQLTVAGTGPDTEELSARFSRANLGDKVKMVGCLSGEDVLKTFLQSDIFLLTSDFEGLPISLLESMAAGCVPVVYDVDSGVRDAIEDGIDGVLVPHGDTAAMARQIAELGRSRQRLNALSAASMRRQRECFSLEGMASAYRSTFERILSQNWPNVRRDGRIRAPYDLTLVHRIKLKLLRWRS